MVRSWMQARLEVANVANSARWGGVRGPVSAAWAHLLRYNAIWKKPFTITLLDHEINILTTPPKIVMQVMRAHARRHVDREMVARLALDNEWDEAAVSSQYQHGVNWDQLRCLLNDAAAPLDGRERRALVVAACGGFWPEERRWRKGIADSSSCSDCHTPSATAQHRIHQCIAMVSKEVEWRLTGVVGRRPRAIDDAAHMPLSCMALPPIIRPWRPIEVELVEGEVQMGHDRTFGDGSGYLQHHRELRVATWALIAMGTDGDHPNVGMERVRGTVAGWMSTVPRAEIQAFLQHARRAGPGATFVSDCRYVVDTVTDDLPALRASARDVNADLWREARKLREDHGAPFHVTKIKAHRSRTAAEREAGELGVADWQGNDAADHFAKELARSAVKSDNRAAQAETDADRNRQMMIRVAKGVAAAFDRWPQTFGTVRQCEDAEREDGTEIPHEERHVIRRAHDGGMECARCRRTARGKAGRRQLEREACAGEICDRIDGTHVLRVTNGITWCEMCGSYTSRWPRALLNACPRRPKTAARRNVLRRLQCGLAPTTADYLQAVAEHEGNPAGVADHQAEVAWRTSTRAYAEEDGEGGAAGNTDKANRGGSGVCRVLSAPPAGRYHRLAGGRLYRPPRGGDEQRADEHGNEMPGTLPGSSPPVAPHGHEATDRMEERAVRVPRRADQDAQPRPGQPTCRRRLRGKQRPVSQGPEMGAVKTSDEPPSAMSHLCRPGDNAQWAGRLKFQREAVITVPCHLCLVSTRTLCRGCNYPICISCARQRMPCAHGSRAAKGAVSHPSVALHSAVPVTVSGFNRHHHDHHHGIPVHKPLEVPHSSSSFSVHKPLEIPHSSNSFYAHTQDQSCSSRQMTLQEVEAKQHTVTVAAPLPDSVFPLSQVPASPVVVVAEAADLSHEAGPPQQRDKQHVGKNANQREVSPSMSTSAAAAGSSSYEKAHSQ